MLELGVQTKNAVMDNCPYQGFLQLKEAGFTCADFSLNSYLLNTELYRGENNGFFNQSVEELLQFFTPHKEGAGRAGIRINQMHMPYPNYVPNGSRELNEYLWHEVAPKSMEICAFLECPYIVIHGFKLAKYLGSEEMEWEQTERFLDFLAPMAKEKHITVCIENLYDSIAGHLVEGPCCDAKKAVGRIEKINKKYGAEVLGFCFDTGHANLVGIDFEDFIATLGQHLKVLHIHDNDGIGDLHQIPYTFTKTRENTSSTDWEGFLRGLRKIDFEGVLSFETAPVLTSFPEEMRMEALSFIAKIGRYFSDKCSCYANVRSETSQN